MTVYQSDSERFDPTEAESSFILEGASYPKYKYLTDESMKSNILDDTPMPTNAFCNHGQIKLMSL